MTAVAADPRVDTATIERVLDLARWAPSGDNTQPWRFEIVDERRFVVHAHDTRDHCVYDLDGRASQIAIGTLLETIEIAASGEGLRALVTRRELMPETQPTFDVELIDAPDAKPDPLLPFVTERVTQRRPMRTDPLTDAQRRELEAAVDPDFRVVWKATPRERRQMARLLFRSAWIRLTIPEAYEVHRTVIEWNARYSEDRMPDQAVGLDPVALKFMRWAMGSWRRVQFLNRYLAGTLLPRLQLDYLPAVRCSAHFTLVASRPPETLDHWLAAGRAVQRFWLTATKLGLQLQPEMTPLIFSRYAREGLRFTGADAAIRRADRVSATLDACLGGQTPSAIFLGRLGAGAAPTSRSTRLSLQTLVAASRDVSALTPSA